MLLSLLLAARFPLPERLALRSRGPLAASWEYRLCFPQAPTHFEMKRLRFDKQMPLHSRLISTARDCSIWRLLLRLELETGALDFDLQSFGAVTGMQPPFLGIVMDSLLQRYLNHHYFGYCLTLAFLLRRATPRLLLRRPQPGLPRRSSYENSSSNGIARSAAAAR